MIAPKVNHQSPTLMANSASAELSGTGAGIFGAGATLQVNEYSGVLSEM
jgi:hypothetical protein